MSPRNSWFWTAERLRELVNILKEDLAEQDDQGWYFGPQGLQMRTYFHLRDKEHTLADGSITDALSALSFLGVIERGKGGKKEPGFKRRFYPEKVSEITEEAVNRFREYKANL
ncbi:MAG TPA: hypothetical protein VJ841_00930 [Candidatus Saccharimonadales bacterium]|nr:hypothetical protein [Candidatus Saccharimonadales bacterium]